MTQKKEQEKKIPLKHQKFKVCGTTDFSNAKMCPMDFIDDDGEQLVFSREHWGSKGWPIPYCILCASPISRRVYSTVEQAGHAVLAWPDCSYKGKSFTP